MMFDPVNAFLMLCLIAGYCQLMAAAINRTHCFRLRAPHLRRMRLVHDLLLIIVSAAMVWFVGINGPQLLYGGSWSEMPVGWMLFSAVCVPGIFGLLAASAKNLFSREPWQWHATRSETFDIAKRLGQPPVGSGRRRLSSRIPGNEMFQLEVNEKECCVAGLPTCWDGLSIVQLSDLHFTGLPDKPYFEEVCQIAQEMQGDLVVFTGDLIDEQRLTAWLPTTLGQLSAPLGKYFILGNHDWYQPLTASIRRAMCDIGWIDVAGKTKFVSHQGRTLAIGGSELPWMGEHPEFNLAGDADMRLLLSHSPDNLPWARQQGVDLMLSGHNHGGQVRLPVIGPVYSPSAYGVRYASGVFFESPTLLHVSRGISGETPLRINCKPELTKIILRPVRVQANLREAASATRPLAVTAAAS